MAIQQVKQSFQNDGNFSLLELKDLDFDGITMRLETFRASHPAKGNFDRTAAKTTAEFLTGSDHLTKGSNQIFRYIFSIKDPKTGVFIVTLELREKFYEDGSWDVKMRDLDYRSPSYGTAVTCTINLCKEAIKRGYYRLVYEVYNPEISSRFMIVSPLSNKITSLDKQFADISQANGRLGKLRIAHTIDLKIKTLPEETADLLEPLVKRLEDTMYSTFAQNVEVYLRFNNFRYKCVHTGENLIGDRPKPASEYMAVHPCRASMILFGRLFDKTMEKVNHLKPGISLWTEQAPLSYDVKPAGYLVFILAHILNIEIYQLSLDKLHSDYGGVPMKLKPGSKLENEAQPVKNAYLANLTLAEIAVAFYAPHVATRLK